MESRHRAAESGSPWVRLGSGSPYGHEPGYGFATIGDQDFPSLAHNLNKF
jgi:hypothetical protein